MEGAGAVAASLPLDLFCPLTPSRLNARLNVPYVSVCMNVCMYSLPSPNGNRIKYRIES